MGVKGQRVLNVAVVLIVLIGAGVWLVSKNYWFSAMWAIWALVALHRTVIDWNKPPAALSTDPLRSQLFIGVALAGAFAWLFFNAP
jgi:hypothetical protein